MSEPLSYFVVGAAAYMMATLFKNFTMGFWIAYTLHAVWIGLQGFGLLVSPWQTLVLYYIVATAWAFLGFSKAKLWHDPPLLNGVFLSHAFYGIGMKPKVDADHEGISRISSKMLFWLVWMVGAFIVFSLQTPGFPSPWPGVVGTIAFIIGYLVLYAILRNEADIFKSSGRGRWGEVATYCFWFGMKHVLFALVYFILETATSTAFWYDDMWNFWFSLIVWFVCLLVTFLTSASARKSDDRKSGDRNTAEL